MTKEEGVDKLCSLVDGARLQYSGPELSATNRLLSAEFSALIGSGRGGFLYRYVRARSNDDVSGTKVHLFRLD